VKADMVHLDDFRKGAFDDDELMMALL